MAKITILPGIVQQFDVLTTADIHTVKVLPDVSTQEAIDSLRDSVIILTDRVDDNAAGIYKLVQDEQGLASLQLVYATKEEFDAVTNRLQALENSLQSEEDNDRQFHIRDVETIERQIAQLQARMGAVAPAEAIAALVQRNNEFGKQLIDLAPNKYPLYIEDTGIGGVPNTNGGFNNYTINGRVVAQQKIVDGEEPTVYIGTSINPVSNPIWSGQVRNDGQFEATGVEIPFNQVMFWAVTHGGVHYNAPFYYSYNVLA